MAHPEYKLEHRMLLDKIDYGKGTIDIKGVTYELRDANFPTIDPENPYELTKEEKEMLMHSQRNKELEKPAEEAVSKA